jgi:hypothetical protein
MKKILVRMGQVACGVGVAIFVLYEIFKQNTGWVSDSGSLHSTSVSVSVYSRKIGSLGESGEWAVSRAEDIVLYGLAMLLCWGAMKLQARIRNPDEAN